MNHSEAEKELAIAKQHEHLQAASRCRAYMNACIDQSKQLLGEFTIGPHEPLTGPEMAHYCFDFAQ